MSVKHPGLTCTQCAISDICCPHCYHNRERTDPVARRVPTYCAATVYRKRWPETCSRKAVNGTRYCKQHGKAS